MHRDVREGPEESRPGVLCRRVLPSALEGLESTVVPLDEDRRPTRIETCLRAGVPPFAALASGALTSSLAWSDDRTRTSAGSAPQRKRIRPNSEPMSDCRSVVFTRPAGSRYDHPLRGCNGQDLCGKISANHFFLDGFVSNHRECSGFPQDDERRDLATRHVASRSDRRLGVPFPPQDPICPDYRVPVQVGGGRKGKTGKPLSPGFCRVSQKRRHPVSIHPRCNKFL